MILDGDEVTDGLDAAEQWKIYEKDKILEARRSPLVQKPNFKKVS